MRLHLENLKSSPKHQIQIMLRLCQKKSQILANLNLFFELTVFSDRSCSHSQQLEGTLQAHRQDRSNKCTQVIQTVYLNLFSLYSVCIWCSKQRQSTLQCLEVCLQKETINSKPVLNREILY